MRKTKWRPVTFKVSCSSTASIRTILIVRESILSAFILQLRTGSDLYLRIYYRQGHLLRDLLRARVLATFTLRRRGKSSHDNHLYLLQQTLVVNSRDCQRVVNYSRLRVVSTIFKDIIVTMNIIIATNIIATVHVFVS